MKGLIRKIRSKGRVDAKSRYWVSELLAVDCENAWIHPGWEEPMQKWYDWLSAPSRMFRYAGPLAQGVGVKCCLSVTCFALCCLRRLCVDVVKCCLCHWSCLVAAFSLFVRIQRVGVLRSLLPAFLFEHVSMGQAHNPPTLGTTLCVSRALVPTLAM